MRIEQVDPAALDDVTARRRRRGDDRGDGTGGPRRTTHPQSVPLAGPYDDDRFRLARQPRLPVRHRSRVRARAGQRTGSAAPRTYACAGLRAALGACRDFVRERLGFPLEWTYGGQPPSPADWGDGLEHGFCWIRGT